MIDSKSSKILSGQQISPRREVQGPTPFGAFACLLALAVQLSVVGLFSACVVAGLAAPPAAVEPPTPQSVHGPAVPPEFHAEAEAAAAVRSFFAGRSSGIDSEELEDLSFVAARESRLAGLPIEVVLGLIHVESSGRVAARSHAGAIGLMQLRPNTARALARENGLDWHGPETLADPAANVRLGIRYLAELVERFDDLSTALTAYNWGPTRVSGMLRRGQDLPTKYASRVLGTAGDPSFGA